MGEGKDEEDKVEEEGEEGKKGDEFVGMERCEDSKGGCVEVEGEVWNEEEEVEEGKVDGESG